MSLPHRPTRAGLFRWLEAIRRSLPARRAFHSLEEERAFRLRIEGLRNRWLEHTH